MESSDANRPLRLAFFTPLPPARTGTAEYADALIPELRKLADVEVLEEVPCRFSPAGYDGVIYQIANNPYHSAIYDLALKHPGIVVVHEANLHDLILGMKVNDPKAYFAEVVYETYGAELADLPSGDLARSGLQPRQFSMVRRLLDRSKAVIVHSHFAEAELRMKGFQGSVATIPHGAAVKTVDPRIYRGHCGAHNGEPIIGVFGYFRPDKMACEALAVFKALLEFVPDARFLAVGQPHPEVPLAARARELGIEDRVTIREHVSIEEFDGYLAACDLVLNLRWPTYGETSGTMMRAFGLGKAVIVSDVGAARELPDEICARIPHDNLQPAVLLKALAWLLGDRTITEQMGRGAQQWVSSTCTWNRVAHSYVEFVSSVLRGGKPVVAPTADGASLRRQLYGWVRPASPECQYLEGHLARLVRTLQLIPPGNPESRILEMGCYMQMTPALQSALGYGCVRGCYLGSGGVDEKFVRAPSGEIFRCDIDLFDVEATDFPYPANHFDTVLCCELLEHLHYDPMRAISEAYRVLKPGGVLVLTTPNLTSLRAVSSILRGFHPGFYTRFVPPQNRDERRHAREYTPTEVSRLLADAGFVVVHVDTGPYGNEISDFKWAEKLLMREGLPAHLRGECIYALGRKATIPRNRFPSWLYDE